MERYMLGTKMCIYLMKNQPEQCYVGDVVMSAITFAELEYGVSASDDPAPELDNLTALAELITVEPFGIAAARAYGQVRIATRDRKKDHLDKLIASHAIALNTVLVTNNTRDFLAYPRTEARKLVSRLRAGEPGHPVKTLFQMAHGANQR